MSEPSVKNLMTGSKDKTLKLDGNLELLLYFPLRMEFSTTLCKILPRKELLDNSSDPSILSIL